MFDRRKKCLVLGVNGQDGSYAAEHLLLRGHSVTGIGRQQESRWLRESDGFSYHQLDLTDVNAFTEFLSVDKPDVIFHLAAIHGAAGFSYEDHWADAHYVNTLVTHAVLEYLRPESHKAQLVYLSSSKAFGLELPPITSEKSERKSTCIYSTTKNAATDLIRYYRLRHGVRGSVVWTFNHESPRRNNSYFIPQIVEILARSILDRNHKASIGTLQFWCDWGDANEYMSIVADIADYGVGDDIVLATGNTVWANDVVSELFNRYGLQVHDHIEERMIHPLKRPLHWRADVTHLKNVLGRIPLRTIQNVCDDILRLNFPKAWAIAGL